MSRDVQSFTAGLFILIGGSLVLGLGELAGIGIGGYFLGGVLGLAGAAAVGAGAGIIVGGLLVLTGIGFGIYGIVNACINAHAAAKLRKEANRQQQSTIKVEEIPGSTQSIMRSTSAENITKEVEWSKQQEPQQQINVTPAPVKQSFWSRLFRRRDQRGTQEVSSDLRSSMSP